MKTYEVIFRIKMGKPASEWQVYTFDAQGGSPRVALGRAMRHLPISMGIKQIHQCASTANDYQLSAGEYMLITIQRKQ